MKIALVETNSAPLSHNLDNEVRRRWGSAPLPASITEELAAADAVIHLFSPHAPHLLRPVEGLEVIEYRLDRGYSTTPRGRYHVRLEGTTDYKFASAQNERLKTDYDGPGRIWTEEEE